MKYDCLVRRNIYILSKISKGNDPLLEYYTQFQQCINSAYLSIISSYKLLEIKLILDNSIQLPNAVDGRKIFHQYRESLDDQYFKEFNTHIKCYSELTKDKKALELFIEAQFQEDEFEDFAEYRSEEFETGKTLDKNELLTIGEEIELLNTVNEWSCDLFKSKIARLKKEIKKRKTYSVVKVNIHVDHNNLIIKHIDSFYKSTLKYLDDINKVYLCFPDDDYKLVMSRVKGIINQSKTI